MNRLFAVVVVAACSGRAQAPTPVTPPDVTRPDGGLTPADAPAADGGKATRANCTAAIDHVIDLDVAERPADQRPSATELDKARSDLHAQLVPRCLQELTPAQTDCIVRAASTAMAKACAGTLLRAE